MLQQRQCRQTDGQTDILAAWFCFHARTCAELLCKLPSEVEGDSSEVGVPQQVVQVVAQQLKHQAEMVPKHKVTLQVDCTETD